MHNNIRFIICICNTLKTCAKCLAQIAVLVLFGSNRTPLGTVEF